MKQPWIIGITLAYDKMTNIDNINMPKIIQPTFMFWTEVLIDSISCGCAFGCLNTDRFHTTSGVTVLVIATGVNVGEQYKSWDMQQMIA